MDIPEIVLEIQNGREDLYLELWERVRRFAAHICRALLIGTNAAAYGGADLDDLMQCAFLALYSAVGKWTPGRGGFLAYYKPCIFSSVKRWTGRRTERQARDPLATAGSLDAPIQDKDGNSRTIADTVPDPVALDDYAAVEERQFQDGLRKRLDAVLSRLPDESADRLRAQYFDLLPVTVLAERYGLTMKQVYSRHDADMKRLRKILRSTPEGREIRRYIEDSSDFYLRFPRNGETPRPVEALAIFREKLEHDAAAQYLAELRIYGEIKDYDKRQAERGA